MALPKINLPISKLTLPVSNMDIEIRPFTVKEEKIFLAAKESNDTDQVVLALRQLLGNCIVSDKVKVDELSLIDVQYIMIKLRAISISNIIDIQVKNPDNPKDLINIEINLNDLQYEKNEEHTSLIKLNEDLVVQMGYPKLRHSKMLEGNLDDPDAVLALLRDCIESIATKEEVHNPSDYTIKELDEFIENLDLHSFNKIQKFFETAPRLFYKKEYTFKSGETKTLEVQGTSAFFT